MRFRSESGTCSHMANWDFCLYPSRGAESLGLSMVLDDDFGSLKALFGGFDAG